MASSDLQLPLPDFLDAVAAETAAPGGGSVSAVAGALAAALVEMAARYAHDWDGRDAAVERAADLRARLVKLAAADAEAYAAYLAAAPEDKQAALAHATDVPLAVAQAAAEVAEVAADVNEHGNRRLAGDVFAGARLATAATEAAANLAKINREEARSQVPEPTSGG